MAIVWNKVTWYSKLLAVMVFVLAIVGAFYLGAQYEVAVTPPALIPDCIATIQTCTPSTQSQNINTVK